MNFLGLGRLETIIEALIVAIAAAAFTYIGLRNPFLLESAKVFCIILYVMAPSCWVRPLSFRVTHLVLWLTLVLCWRIWDLLTSWHQAESAGVLFVAAEIIFGPFVDLAFLTNGLMAVRSKLERWEFATTLHFFILIMASAAGMTASLLFWSSLVAEEIASNAINLSQNKPFCLATNGKLVTDSSELSGLRLLRHRYFAGEGAGFSIPIFSRFYLILAVEQKKQLHYWNWSFRAREFQDLSFPVSHFVNGYACDPRNHKAL